MCHNEHNFELQLQFSDDRNNEIWSLSPLPKSISYKFSGSYNQVYICGEVQISFLSIIFDGNNGCIRIHDSLKHGQIRAHMRVGGDSKINIGRGVSMNNNAGFSAAEGTTISIGEDCMFASGNRIRTDDAHPIFDVSTGDRVNPSSDITVEDHVWLAQGASVLGGSYIRSGTTIGMNSIVNGFIPNNCVAVGSPAQVVRKNTVWERPHLSITYPKFLHNADGFVPRRYWKLTEINPLKRDSQVRNFVQFIKRLYRRF